jgi:hypothetical protein
MRRFEDEVKVKEAVHTALSSRSWRHHREHPEVQPATVKDVGGVVKTHERLPMLSDGTPGSRGLEDHTNITEADHRLGGGTNLGA